MPEILAANLPLFAKFIVPGFIAVKVWDLLVPSTRRDFSKMVVELVAYSMLFFPLVEFANGKMMATNWDTEAPLRYAVGLILAAVVPAAVITVLFYWFRRLTARVFKISSPVPTGYDDAFGRGASYVYFHLKDGRVLAGSYDQHGGAGDSASSREIFVHNPHFVDENGNYMPMGRAQHALVRYEDCQLVGFEFPAKKGGP